jgi:hypothetical protein
MGEMLKHRTILGEQTVEHRFAVTLIAAPQNMVVGAGDDLNGVELHEAEGLDQGGCVQRSRRGLAEAVGGKPKVAGLIIGDFERGGHARKGGRMGGRGQVGGVSGWCGAAMWMEPSLEPREQSPPPMADLRGRRS